MFNLEFLREACKTIEGIKELTKEQLYYAYKYIEEDKIQINDECFSIITNMMCCYY